MDSKEPTIGEGGIEPIEPTVQISARAVWVFYEGSDPVGGDVADAFVELADKLAYDDQFDTIADEDGKLPETFTVNLKMLFTRRNEGTGEGLYKVAVADTVSGVFTLISEPEED